MFWSVRVVSNMLGFWKCIFVCLVCFVLNIVIFNELIGLSVIFCIYEHIQKLFLHFPKMYTYCCFRREILLVWSAVIITGVSLEILLVLSAVITTGMVGGNYYWYCLR